MSKDTLSSKQRLTRHHFYADRVTAESLREVYLAAEVDAEIERLERVELKYTNLCQVLNEQAVEIGRLKRELADATAHNSELVRIARDAIPEAIAVAKATVKHVSPTPLDLLAERNELLERELQKAHLDLAEALCDPPASETNPSRPLRDALHTDNAPDLSDPIAWAALAHEDARSLLERGGGDSYITRLDRACGILFARIEELEKKLYPIGTAVEPKNLSAFWVIERFENDHGAGYWDGGSSRTFVTDIDLAVHFCRRQDAFWATRGWHWTDTKITEHIPAR